MRVRASAAVIAAVAASAGFVAPTADAYQRLVFPLVVAATCNSDTDEIYVQWSKDDGKPIYFNVDEDPNYTADHILADPGLKIPGSRGSKGNWTVPSSLTGFDFAGNQQVMIVLVGSFGEGYYPVLCTPTS